MSLSFLERLPSNYLQINFHQFESNEVSLRFIRQRDSLLSVDFLFSGNKVTIVVSSYLPEHNSNHKNHNKMIDTITNVNIGALQLRYNPSKNMITLTIIEFASEHVADNTKTTCSTERWSRKCRIRDFNYEWVALLHLKASLHDLDSDDDQNTQTIIEFTNETRNLPQFDEFRRLLEQDQVDADQLVSCFNETIRNQYGDYKTHQDQLIREVDRIQDDVKSPKQDLPLVNQLSPTMVGPVTLVSHISPDETIILTPEGRFRKTGSHPTNGTWNATMDRLFLFQTQSLEYHVLRLHNNRFYEDSEEQYWVISNNNIDGHGIISTRNISESLIVMVITCHSRLHLVQQINRSWGGDLRKLGIRVWFVIGGSKESQLEGSFLRLSCPDNYESLPKKVYSATQFILHNATFQHLYKVDDDTLVNPRQLLSIPLDKYHYLGRKQTVTNEFNRYWHRGKCENKSLNQIPYPVSRIRYGTSYAKGEAGYFLSRKAVEMLGRFKSSICSDLYEDKAIGDALSRANLEVSEDPRYQAKLYENFDKSFRLDKFCVIVDIGSKMSEVYQKLLKCHLT